MSDIKLKVRYRAHNPFFVHKYQRLLFTFVKFTSKSDYIYLLVYYEHKKTPLFLVFVTFKFIFNVECYSSFRNDIYVYNKKF